MVSPNAYAQASIKTADNLRSVAHSTAVRDLSQLSLPEIDAAVDVVARLVPAGNVPGVILNGLARLPGRRPPAANVQRDVNLLFKGVEAALDKAVYGAFFAGPAAVIWGYQNILKLAGKDPEQAFPQGLWQFYVEYALREDSARHTIETGGFDAMLSQHQLILSPVDRLTAWVVAAGHVLHQYPDLLANEWRERIYLSVLAAVTAGQPDAAHYADLLTAWQRLRPYARGRDASPKDNYTAYRRHQFDQFLAANTRQLSAETYQAWTQQLESLRQALKEYQQQLSIWAYLEPGAYGEMRTPLSWAQLHVGLVIKGRYYLLPVSSPDSTRPFDVTAVRETMAALLAVPTGTTAVKLSSLATIKRAAQADLRRSLNKTITGSLSQLHYAPILLNFDQRPPHLALGEIRQGERGIGDQPMTLFDTGQTMVFDLSPLFFDSAWGAALAEIFTQEAMAWAAYLHSLPPINAGSSFTIKPLTFPLESVEKRFIEQSPRLVTEVCAETEKANMQVIAATRQAFKQRSERLGLTVSDLLILYRAIHAFTYQADPNLVAEVAALAQTPRNREAVAATQAALAGDGTVNPAILIPIDASRQDPRDRVYPLVFEVPLQELDLWELHGRALAALTAYKQRELPFAEFDAYQRTYLAALAGLGQVLGRAKEIGVHGQSARAGAVRMLANVPGPVQRLLEAMPNRFDVLNDLIKGREFFANVGQVAAQSTLTRFSTAKDDSEKMSLAWGVLTDANGQMRITLRDFRPHVAALHAVGYKALAARLTQHYLDTYAEGLNAYVRDLRRIAEVSPQSEMRDP